MRNSTLRLIWLLLTVGHVALSQTWTWTGNNGSDWGNGSNWSQGSVPLPTSAVLIPGTLSDGKPWPVLSNADAFAGSITLSPGSRLDLNGRKLTVSGSVSIVGATVSGTGAETIVIEAGVLNGGAHYLRNSTFETGLDFKTNGSSTLYEADDVGANTYDGDVTFTIAATGTHFISTGYRSSFKGSLIVDRTIAGATQVITGNAGGTGKVAGDFSYKNHAGGATTIGGAGNKTVIDGSLTVDVATASTNPDFTLRGLENSLGGGMVSVVNPGTLHVSDNALTLTNFVVTGKIGGGSTLARNVFTGEYAYSDGITNSGPLYSYGNVFEGAASFVFNGSSANGIFYESHEGAPEGNIYKENASFTTGSAAALNIGYSRSAVFEKGLTVERTSIGLTNILTNGGSVGAGFEYTNRAGGATVIGNVARTIMIGGAVAIQTDHNGEGGFSAFSLFGLRNETGEGDIDIRKFGTFNVSNNVLTAREIRLVDKNGGSSTLSGNVFKAGFAYSDVAGNSGPLYSYGNIFEEAVTFSFNGTSANSIFYESHDASQEGNVYKKNAVFNTASAATLHIGYSRPVTLGGALSVVRTAEGITNILLYGGSIATDFRYTNTKGGATTIGSSLLTIPVGGSIDILTDYAGEGSYPAFYLYGLRNEAGGGNIEIKKAGTFEVSNSVLIAESIRLTGKSGGSSSLSRNIFKGIFNYADEAGNTGPLYSHGNVFGETTVFSLNGISANSIFYESHEGSPDGNVYKKDVVFSTGSAAGLNLGYARPVVFEGSLSVERTSVGVTNILANGGSVGNDFSYTNTIGGASSIGYVSHIIPVGGRVDILTDYPGEGSFPTFYLYGIQNAMDGGQIEIKKAGTFDISNNTLKAGSVRLLGRSGGSSTLSRNVFSAAFTYSDIAGNSGPLYSYGNVFDGIASFSFNSTSSNAIFYESHDGAQTGNVYKDDTVFERLGSSSLHIAWARIARFHKNLRFNSSAGLTFNNAIRFEGDRDGVLVQAGSQELRLSGIQVAKSGEAKLVLNSPVHISQSVSFENGYILTDEANSLHFSGNANHSGASDESHVVGPVRKTGNTAFTFPVGNGVVYHPIAISAPPGGEHLFSAEYKASDIANFNPASFLAPLEKVSDEGYWDLKRLTGNSGVYLTLSYKVPAGFITSPSDLRVAHWNSGISKWEGLDGAADETSNGTEGRVVTQNPVTDFSPFALSTTNFEANPLPVKLAAFSVRKEGESTLLQWLTTEEFVFEGFEVERSDNGSTWQVIGWVPSAGKGRYSFGDFEPGRGNQYYRLKMIDLDASYSYSEVRSITGSVPSTPQLLVYPNPVSDYLHIKSALQMAIRNLELFDLSGKRIWEGVVSDRDRLDVRGLSSGVYLIRIHYTDGTSALSRFVVGR